MKECPNCRELVGDNVDKCFKCGFDFITKTMPTDNSTSSDGAQQNLKPSLYRLNNEYEYYVVTVNDLSTGEADTNTINYTLSEYAKKGWRLHTIYTNELGKDKNYSTNATIDQTVIVFERIVYKAEE